MKSRKNEARIIKAVANAIEEMKTMSDVEIQVLSVQWVVLASWDDMSQAMAAAYTEELKRRMAK